MPTRLLALPRRGGTGNAGEAAGGTDNPGGAPASTTRATGARAAAWGRGLRWPGPRPKRDLRWWPLRERRRRWAERGACIY